ncbi:hypothetical protein IL308_05865 [Lactococcus lactis]|uniref:hypothetical protein n=1 Tax=Lactococcus lactis TaxID=1358 RepID=UPI00191253D6|nr:hypothetical protein [Lactococcus lactis]MBK5076317.1 hypothetical protein [Lactococcus lactis]
MELDLIQSPVYRQSILNNSIAIKEVEKNLGLNQLYFTNQQVADFYEVSLATIERTISDNSIELKSNGLRTLRGQELEEVIAKDFVTLKNDGHKVVNLTVSTFKTVLNFGMLLKTSEKARLIRTKILDVTVEVLENKTSKNTKFINQRDKDYLSQAQREAIERKKFTNAIKEYIDMGNYKYAYFTKVNGYPDEVINDFIQKMEALILMLVEKEICKDDLNGYIYFIINQEEMPEELLVPLEIRLKKERGY